MPVFGRVASKDASGAVPNAHSFQNDANEAANYKSNEIPRGISSEKLNSDSAAIESLTQQRATRSTASTAHDTALTAGSAHYSALNTNSSSISSATESFYLNSTRTSLSLTEQLQLRRSGSQTRLNAFSNNGSSPFVASPRAPSPITLDSQSTLRSNNSKSPSLYVDEDTRQYLRPFAKNDVADVEESAYWAEKKLVWLEDDAEGYVSASTLGNASDDKIQVQLDNGAKKLVEKSAIQRMNPPKFDKVEDMAELTYLNELSVLHNLKERYYANLIYTYSGLFLIAVNPYRELPIYGFDVAKMYAKSKRKEVPPHVFAVADSAYRLMLENNENQSILITGESGAGKTENTKKVIQYLAVIASERGSDSNVDCKLLAANPILEAFGNAQTIRNNNSSRFGKFIKIQFNSIGQISSAYIEKYLLEKSRVTHQSSQERNFHIFYQFLAGAPQDLKRKFFIDGTLSDYAFVRNSNLRIDGVDDFAQFSALISAFETLGFTETEKNNLFKTISIILLMGNMRFEEDKNGNALFAETEYAEKICRLLGIQMADFSKALLRPIIKAGRDSVAQNRNLAQVTYSVEALCRTMYDRMFSYLIDRINKSLNSATSSKSQFIGVLDIAGFEIFDANSFEQLCINYTNEKLQQFFNHHMFIQEQEEYQKEGIEWKYVDFGLDLQPVIDMIEKSNPIGIFPCLDEESVMPKASDKTFSEKLNSIWKGKGAKYEAHRFDLGFAVQHYAGRVEYTTQGWIDKNKDPLNENVTKLFARSTDSFISEMFRDYFGDEDDIVFINKCKKGAFRTVSQKYREQLHSLMNHLSSTHPQFIRCILPNDFKKPSSMNCKMVLEQLRCNGVLEGIRVTRQGFPNRLFFFDFVRRYGLVLPESHNLEYLLKDTRASCQKIIDFIALDQSKYRIGMSKVFFKAGSLAELEDHRESKLTKLIISIQSIVRQSYLHKIFENKRRNTANVLLLQRVARHYGTLKDWPWWKLFSKLRPLLKAAKVENKIDDLNQTISSLKAEIFEKSECQKSYERLIHEKEQDRLKIEEVLLLERQAFNEQSEVLHSSRERQSLIEEDLKSALNELENYEQLIKKFQIEVNEAKKQHVELISQLSASKLAIEKVEREKHTIKNQLDELISLKDTQSTNEKSLLSEKRSLEALLREYENDLAEKQAECLKHSAKLQEGQMHNNSLEEKLKQLNIQAEELKEEIVSLTNNSKQSSDDYEFRIRQKETELVLLKENLEKMNHASENFKRESSIRISSKEQEIEALKGELAKIKNDYQEHLNQLQSSFTEKGNEQAKQSELLKAMKEQELNFLKEKIFELETYKAKSITELENYRVTIETYTSDIANLTQSKENLIVQQTENCKNLEEANSRLTTSERQLKDLQQQYNRVENFKASLEVANNSLKKESSDFENQILSLKNEVSKLELEKSTLISNLNTLKADIESDTAHRISLEQAKRKLADEINELYSKLDELQVSNSQLEKQLLDKESEIEKVKSKYLADLEEKSAAKKIAEKCSSEALIKVEELSIALSKAEKNKISFLSDLEDCQAQLESLSSEKRAAERQCKLTESELVSFKKENSLLKRQYEEMESLYRSGIESLDLETSEVNRLSGLLKLKESEISVLNEDLENERKEKRKKSLIQASEQTSPHEDLVNSNEYCSKSMLNETIDRYENKVSLLIQENSQLKAMNERLKSQRSSFSEAETEAAVTEFKTTIKKLESRVQELDESLEESKEASNSLKASFGRQISELESKNALLKEENSNFVQTVQDYITQISYLNEELDSKAFEMEKFSSIKRKLLSEIEDLKSQISADYTNKNEDSVVRKRLSSELTQIREELEMANHANDNYQNDIRILNSKVQSLNIKIESLETTLESTETALERAQKTLNIQNDQLDEAGSERLFFTEKIKKLEDQIKNNQQSLSALEQSLNEATASKKKLSDELDQIKNKSVKELTDRISEYERHISRLTSEMEDLYNTVEDEKLNSYQLKQMRTEDELKINQLSARLESEMSSFVSAKKEKDRLEAKFEELSMFCASLEEKLDGKTRLTTSQMSNIKDLKVFLESLENSLASSERQRKLIDESYKSLEVSFDALQSNSMSKDRKIKELEMNFNALKVHLDEENEQRIGLIDRLRKTEEQNSLLQADIAKHKEAVLNMSKEKGLLERQIREMSKKSLEVEAMGLNFRDSGKLSQELNALQNEFELVLQEKQDLVKECKKFERQVSSSIQESNDLREEIAKLRDSLHRLNDKNQNSAQQIESLESREKESALQKRKSERLQLQLQDKIKSLENELVKIRLGYGNNGGTASLISRSSTPSVSHSVKYSTAVNGTSASQSTNPSSVGFRRSSLVNSLAAAGEASVGASMSDTPDSQSIVSSNSVYAA